MQISELLPLRFSEAAKGAFYHGSFRRALMLRAGESATSAHKIGIIHIMKRVRNRHDRRFLAWFAGIMPPWLAVYAEIYFLDKFII
ncbi:hypothetical protein [Klebsiella pneumoniae]|uniref:hypothetical protein n=1 Tax=Klebsiella pneumoniae TaxID=573 RepID=UPI001E30E8CF|nr:hypothetical protein [Klebsiella pneumoniae]